MPVALVRTTPQHTAVPSVTLLRTRARFLGVTDAEFDACVTMGELQQHVKRHYRHLVQRYHPDHNMTCPGLGASMFRKLTARYQRLMAIPKHLRLLEIEAPLWTEYRRLCAPLGYEIAPTERRTVEVGWGWQVV